MTTRSSISRWSTPTRAASIAIVLVVAAATLAAATRATPVPSRPVQLCRSGLAQLVGPPRADGRPAYIACLPVLSQPSRESRLDLRYSDAASNATSSTALAVCWSRRDWKQIDAVASAAFGDGTAMTGGFVWEDQQIANLPPRLCRHLDRALHERRLAIERWTAWAFKNLTHEALHVAGVDDEAQTECYAVQRMAQTIMRLGFRRHRAERLAALSWSRYQRLRAVQPLYFSTDCRNRGRLDLEPRSRRWPTG